MDISQEIKKCLMETVTETDPNVLKENCIQKAKSVFKDAAIEAAKESGKSTEAFKTSVHILAGFVKNIK